MSRIADLTLRQSLVDLNFQDFFDFYSAIVVSCINISCRSFQKKTLRLDPPVIGVEITPKLPSFFLSFRPMYRGGQYMSLLLVLDQLGVPPSVSDPVEHVVVGAISG